MPSRIGCLKKFDAVLGRLAASCIPAPRSENTVPDPKRILVIRPGGIGDAVLLIPALNAVRDQYPAAEITVLAERRNAAVFALCPAVSHLLSYDQFGDLLRVLCGRYDVVIDTEQWHRLSAVVARLTTSTVKIGYDTNERARLFTHSVAYSHDDYEAVSFFNLLKPLGIAPPPRLPVPFLALPDNAQQSSDQILAGVDLHNLVVIFPGASIPERRWGAASFTELAHRLTREGKSIAVVGGREDAVAGERIAGSAGLNLAGRASLAETAAIIARAAVLVSGDSGVLHIGVGLGIPTVSLFGPGRQHKWGPPGKEHAVLNHALACSPCTTFGTTPECAFHARCLREITVNEVFMAAINLLAEKKT